MDFPGQFNQAMMDLGAMVCLPNGAPLCQQCPAEAFCQARKQGRTKDLPVRPAKKPRRVEERVVFLLFRGGKVALRRRPGKGLLAGLWEYPNELAPAEGAMADWGLTGEVTHGGTGVHIFTHVEWRMTAQCWQVNQAQLPAGWVWADRVRCAGSTPPSAFSPFQVLWRRD